MEQKIYNIFLASSNELRDDRVAFGDFIRHLDNIYEKRGIRIYLFKWEDYDAAYNDCRKQGEYNGNVITSNMFLSLFSTKGGKYTIEEFNVAVDAYRKNKSPKVYVYCKTLQEGQEETPELTKFKRRLQKKLKYFWINYSNQDNLQLHFILQFLQVENSMGSLKLDEGKVKLEETTIAEIKNLPFAANNKDYQRISAELSTLPKEIDSARKFLEEHPDNDYMQGELQKKQNRYNNLKEEFAQLQQTLFETSQRIATMQHENLSDKLRRATEAFEAGNMERANTLLDEIAIDAETHHANLEQNLEIVQQDRELVHQDIEAFLLLAKTKMAEVSIPIEDRIKEVLAIYEKADQWAEDSALPKDKLDGLLNDYASFLYEYGKYKEAEPIYLRLVSLREAMLGKEHPDTATSYNNIGETYRKLGDYPKALEYYFKAMDIFEKVLGKEHPDTATSYNNIGQVYISQGDYTKTLEYNFKALAIREKVLGKEHPDTATTYNDIGVTFYFLENYPKTLEYYFKALDIWEKVLGKEHPFIATSYNNIGSVYDDQGDYPKALEYYFKAVDIKEKVLGKKHPSTATSYNNIGSVYDSQGDYPKALEYYFKALDIVKKVLEEEHPYTATSYNNIGLVYKKQGDYPKALEYLQKALYIYKKKLGSNHPYTKGTKRNIEIFQSKSKL